MTNDVIIDLQMFIGRSNIFFCEGSVQAFLPL